MIIYQSSKKEFVDNTLNPHDRNRGIADIIRVEFEKRIGKVHDAEYHAWKNSLRHMATVVDTPAIPDDATVCVEYRLPYQNSRIDFIIAGKDGSGNENVVIVELKQWSTVTPLVDEHLVQTVITWNNNGKTIRTRGLDADQTEAAIKATMKMLNIFEENS